MDSTQNKEPFVCDYSRQGMVTLPSKPPVYSAIQVTQPFHAA